MRKPERARVAILRKYFNIPADAWYWGICQGQFCFYLGYGRDLLIHGKNAFTVELESDGEVRRIRWLEQFMHGRCVGPAWGHFDIDYCRRDHWLGETRFCRARTS